LRRMGWRNISRKGARGFPKVFYRGVSSALMDPGRVFGPGGGGCFFFSRALGERGRGGRSVAEKKKTGFFKGGKKAGPRTRFPLGRGGGRGTVGLTVGGGRCFFATRKKKKGAFYFLLAGGNQGPLGTTKLNRGKRGPGGTRGALRRVAFFWGAGGKNPRAPSLRQGAPRNSGKKQNPPPTERKPQPICLSGRGVEFGGGGGR